MKSFVFTPFRSAIVFSILFALANLSSAQQNSSRALNRNRPFPVSLENGLAIVRNVNTGEILSVRPAGAPAPGTLPSPATNYTFQTLAAPAGASSTYAEGINSNGTAIAGGYFPATGSNDQGLIYSKAGQISVTYPGAAYTTPQGINDKGEIVGVYGQCQCVTSGFDYLNGQYRAIPSSARVVNPNGISDSNAITLIFIPANGNRIVSVLLAKGGSTQIVFPDSLDTWVNGVNASGEVTGTYSSESGYFGFTDIGGTYTSFEVPGASLVNTAAVSNNGNIAGTYEDSSNVQHGYVLINGAFTTIDYPGATSTQVLGVDDAGDVVGTYFQGPGCTLSGQNCGFLATAQ